MVPAGRDAVLTIPKNAAEFSCDVKTSKKGIKNMVFVCWGPRAHVVLLCKPEVCKQTCVPCVYEGRSCDMLYLGRMNTQRSRGSGTARMTSSAAATHRAGVGLLGHINVVLQQKERACPREPR